MSYEGYREYLCEKGHYTTVDAYEDNPVACSCEARMAHWHSVNCTNGEDPDLPGTMPAPKEQIGTEDEWHEDHYGNRYARAIPLYRPSREWKPLPLSWFLAPRRF